MKTDDYADLLLLRLRRDPRLFTVASLEAYFNEKHIPVLARLFPEKGSIQLICFDRHRSDVEAIRELNADEVTFFVTEFQRLKTLLDGNELKPHMYVRICADYTRKVTDGMKTWIEVNKIRTFRIEKIEGSSIKLFGVDFWITSDLLYPIRS